MSGLDRRRSSGEVAEGQAVGGTSQPRGIEAGSALCFEFPRARFQKPRHTARDKHFPGIPHHSTAVGAVAST